LEAAIDSLTLRGNYTTLNEMVFGAAKMVEDLPVGRKALIILPDSKNNIGTASPDQAISQVQAANTPLYLIGVKTRKIGPENLETFATHTSGLVMVVEPDEVEAILQEIAGQLPQGYRLTYTSKVAADNREHDLSLVIMNQNRETQADGRFVAVSNPVRVSPNLTESQTVGGLVSLTAEVKAPAPPILVEYLVDEQPLAQVSTPPYHFEWNSAATKTGPHILTVKAVDSANNKGQAQVDVNVIPAVKVTISTPQTEVVLGEEIVIQAEIEALNPVVKVELGVDGELVAGHDEPPFSFAFDNSQYRKGQHVISIRAIDSLGQSGNDNLTMEFLPVWPERIRNWLGFTDRAEFEAWVQSVKRVALVIGAIILILLLILLTLLVLRRIKAAQEKYSRQKYGLAILNQGNAQTRYQLWAEDSVGALQFGFFLKGNDLQEQTTEIVEPLPITEPLEPTPVDATPATTPVPEETTEVAQPAPAAKTDQSSKTDSSKAQLKKSEANARKAMGFTEVIGNMLTGIAKILPRSLGGPLLNTANKMRMGRSRIRRGIRMPKQIASTTSQVKSQAKTITPASSGAKASPTPAQSTAASTSTTTQTSSAPAAAQTQPTPITTQTTPSPAATQIYRTPATTVPAHQPSNGKQFTSKTVTVRLDYAQTPLIEPGETLLVDLLIDPLDPKKTKTYSFNVISKPVEQPETAPVIEAGTVRIIALAWFRRYLPIFVVLLITVFLVLETVLLTLWLLDVDIFDFYFRILCEVKNIFSGATTC